MKQIKFDSLFLNSYHKHIRSNKLLYRATKIAIDLFLENPDNPVLRNHELKGNLKNRKAFSVMPNIRIVYIETEKYYLFLDIGTHQEVY